MKKEDLQKEIVQKITVQEFLMGKNRLSIWESIGVFLFASIFITILTLSTDTSAIEKFYIFPVTAEIISLFVCGIIFLGGNGQRMDNRKNIKKGNFSHRYEACEKVLRKGSKWIVETDHGYLFDFDEEVCVGDKIFSAVIGKESRKAYLLNEKGIPYEIISDEEK